MADEYISREAALQAQNKSMNLAECRKRLERIPAADVVPVRHGKWEWNDDNGYYYCSLCKSIAPKEDQDGNYYDWVSYCPHCGADMREVEHENG